MPDRRVNTRENGPGGLKDKVHAYLSRLRRMGEPVWFLKVAGNAMQRNGVADYLVCYNGAFAAIELKTEDGVLSPAQTKDLQWVADAQGRAYVCRSMDEVEQVVSILRGLVVVERDKVNR